MAEADSSLAALLSSMPLPPPPLRQFWLSRRPPAPITALTVGTLAASADKLANLERLHLDGTGETSLRLQQLLAFPALVDLCIDCTATELREELQEAGAVFAAAGRRLHIECMSE